MSFMLAIGASFLFSLNRIWLCYFKPILNTFLLHNINTQLDRPALAMIRRPPRNLGTYLFLNKK